MSIAAVVRIHGVVTMDKNRENNEGAFGLCNPKALCILAVSVAVKKIFTAIDKQLILKEKIDFPCFSVAL
ncbi:hypothetical protein [Bordetella sp. 02P26C-1]|uniref:hypothetical protein n=1 Tax=Bordetella sp. 02P26C-1 TaxID=2683195 RepID=UPI0013523F29|nr:hypothetical protein [Bordetella sp. 02P26C-1]MVW78086.1 hypothetical protein [Bordetella sp. 02P26C-1]